MKSLTVFFSWKARKSLSYYLSSCKTSENLIFFSALQENCINPIKLPGGIEFERKGALF